MVSCCYSPFISLLPNCQRPPKLPASPSHVIQLFINNKNNHLTSNFYMANPRYFYISMLRRFKATFTVKNIPLFLPFTQLSSSFEAQSPAISYPNRTKDSTFHAISEGPIATSRKTSLPLLLSFFFTVFVFSALLYTSAIAFACIIHNCSHSPLFSAFC
jgi:hypothetical protein